MPAGEAVGSLNELPSPARRVSPPFPVQTLSSSVPLRLRRSVPDRQRRRSERYPIRPAGAMNKTLFPPQDSSTRQWYLVDAENQTLGRLASEVASVLRGKNNPNFAPHIDAGDFVVVINAEKVKVSGNKFTEKVYRRHSGRPGGMKTESFAALQARLPERIIEKAVKGMLPHNALGRQLFRKLKVYKGAEHPHAAQQPQALALDPAASAQ